MANLSKFLFLTGIIACSLASLGTGCAVESLGPDQEATGENTESAAQAVVTCGGKLSASATSCRPKSSTWEPWMRQSCPNGQNTNVTYTEAGCASGQARGVSFNCCTGTPAPPAAPPNDTTGATGCVSGKLSAGWGSCVASSLAKSYASTTCSSYAAKTPGNMTYTVSGCTGDTVKGVAFNCCATAGSEVSRGSGATTPPPPPAADPRNTTGATGCVSGNLTGTWGTCTNAPDSYATASCKSYGANKVPGNLSYNTTGCSGTATKSITFQCCDNAGHK